MYLNNKINEFWIIHIINYTWTLPSAVVENAGFRLGHNLKWKYYLLETDYEDLTASELSGGYTWEPQ